MHALRLQPAVKPDQQDDKVLASVRSIVEADTGPRADVEDGCQVIVE